MATPLLHACYIHVNSHDNQIFQVTDAPFIAARDWWAGMVKLGLPVPTANTSEAYLHALKPHYLFSHRDWTTLRSNLVGGQSELLESPLKAGKRHENIFPFKISRAREMHQSVKCLPFVEEDLSLISKIHTALVIPRLGKQRQGGRSSVTQPSLPSILCQWETLSFLAYIYQKDSGSMRVKKQHQEWDTNCLLPPSLLSLKMARDGTVRMRSDRPVFHSYLQWPQPRYLFVFSKDMIFNWKYHLQFQCSF